jgi:predicted nucleic acid-binding protein
MPCLLDTNACIEILRGRNLILKARLAARSLDELTLCDDTAEFTRVPGLAVEDWQI